MFASLLNKNKSNISLNLITNIFQFSIHFLSTFWLTRFFIYSLTPSVYGMFPLARNSIEILSVATSIITIPAGRNLLVDYSRGDILSSNRVFNSFLFGLVLLISCLLPVFLIVSYFAPSLFKAPIGFESQVSSVFISLALSFILMTLSSPFATCAFVKNRLDLKNFGEFFETLIFVIFSYVGITLFNLQLYAISIAVLSRALFRFIYSILLWKFLLPELKVNKSMVDWSALKEFLQLGGWLLLGTFGYVLFNNTDLLIVNRYYGPELTGMYGAIYSIPQAISVLSGSISSVFNPPLIQCFGKNGIDGTIREALRYVRFLSIAVSLPIGLIAGFAKPILKLWLGDDFMSLAPIVIMLTSPLLLSLSMTPLMTLRIIVKKLKLPAVFYVITGIVKIGIILILAMPKFHLGLYGVAIGYVLFLIINFGIFNPLYTAKITNKNSKLFFSSLILPTLCFIFVFIPSIIISEYFFPFNIVTLSFQVTLISIIYTIVAIIWLLKKEEKEWLLKKIYKH